MLTRRTVTASDVPTLRTPAEMKPPTFRRRETLHTTITSWSRSQINSAVIFLHFDFLLGVACSSTNLSYQRDLPATTLCCRCLSLGRFTERRFLADWDYKPAISHGFGHELDFLCLAVHHDTYCDPAAGLAHLGSNSSAMSALEHSNRRGSRR